MEAYQLKKCPHCGKNYRESQHAGIPSKNNPIKYGSPLKVCPVCKKEFLDKDYREIAVEGICEVDMKHVSTMELFCGFIGVVIGIVAVYFGDYDGIIAVFLGIFLPVSEVCSYEKKQKKLEVERKASEERLGNSNYAIILKRLGYDVPEKYLPSDEAEFEEEKHRENSRNIMEEFIKVEKKVTVALTKEEAVNIIRENIIACITEKPGVTYELAALLWDDAARCFRSDWDGAWFKIDLNTGELYADVSKYPNQFGFAPQSTCKLTAGEFKKIAIEFNMSKELQYMETEADWQALFDARLKSVIEQAKKELEERDIRERQKQREKYALVLPTQFLGKTPTMEFTEISLGLQQKYGSSHVLIIIASGEYLINDGRSAHLSNGSIRNSRTLSQAEAAWVEKEVNDCINNPDNTTWSSVAGGDYMTVRIYKNHKPCVELDNVPPQMKYTDLQNWLGKIAEYECISEEEARKLRE